ncbi:hypothetical protein MMC25_007701 [Agyrium rufum]|nr:hypothetical protein [Agyrium rufum]
MSRNKFRSQASSSRAVSGAFGSNSAGFGNSRHDATSAFGSAFASPLSYIFEPPDLSDVTDSNAVVSLKNVQKKDGTTKGKALEELLAYLTELVKEGQPLEEGILEAWIKIYPRTSIDNSPRVRQLAHLLQGQISLLCGRRIAKYLPKLVCPWLAGLYDNDKRVARAAQEAYTQVFSTEEKQKSVWKVYQEPIINYCSDVILRETVASLSDERTTSADDAQGKYARAVGSALSVVGSAIEILPLGEINKQQSTYEDLLRNTHTWKLASNPDAFVRRSVFKLLTAVMDNGLENLVEIQQIQKDLVSVALRSEQRGSAYELVKLLAEISRKHSDIWSEQSDSNTKKSPKRSLGDRICSFIGKGSQGGPPDFWQQVFDITAAFPTGYFSAQSQEEDEDGNLTTNVTYPILESIHSGLSRKDEPKAHQTEAWKVYLKVARFQQQKTGDEQPTITMLEQRVSPILQQYLRPTPKYRVWTIPSTDAADISLLALETLLTGSLDAFNKEWQQLSDSLVEALQTLLPEQSKDYGQSQQGVSSFAQRWYTLQARFLDTSRSEATLNLVATTLRTEIEGAMNVIVTRNGKPYGASSSMAIALSSLPKETIADAGLDALIEDFLKDHLTSLINTPCSRYLISILNFFDAPSTELESACQHAFQDLIAMPESSNKRQAMIALLSSHWLANKPISEDLQQIVHADLASGLANQNHDWSIIDSALANPVVPTDLVDSLLSEMTSGLTVEEQASASLEGLSSVVKTNPSLVNDYTLSKDGVNLLTRLIYLSDSPDASLAARAKIVEAAIRCTTKGSEHAGKVSEAIIAVIERGIGVGDDTTLPIETLIQQAVQLIEAEPLGEQATLAGRLLPECSRWQDALEAALPDKVNISLAMTNPIGGAVYFIESRQHSQQEQAHLYDEEGLSSLLRLARFAVGILRRITVFRDLSETNRALLLKYLSITIQLATDNLSVHGSSKIWLASPDTENEFIEFLGELQTLVASWLSTFQDLALEVLTKLAISISSEEVLDYYSSRAFVTLFDDVAELHLGSMSVPQELRLEDSSCCNGPLRVVTQAAVMVRFLNSKQLLRNSNVYLDEIAALDFVSKSQEALLRLTAYNNLLTTQSESSESIPQRRLLFYVKHLAAALLQPKVSADSFLIAEVCKNLLHLLPRVSDIYDEFWETILSVIPTIWSITQLATDDDLPKLHASLRLCSKLQILASEESNEDLHDAWSEKQEAINDALLQLLKTQSGENPRSATFATTRANRTAYADENHQPRKMVNNLIARRLVAKPNITRDNEASLYPIMASESSVLQGCGYRILHQLVPTLQEQISLEAALSDTFTAKLPVELLSLVLTPPSRDPIENLASERELPIAIRKYLLSWILVFDHWASASAKVQSQYADAIKDDGYLEPLLNCVFENLITNRSRPLDASKVQLESYDLDSEETPQKELHRLLCHLYYLSLLNLPHLCKTWWRDSTSRQLQRPIETWTEKYISPTVISTVFDTLSQLKTSIEAPLEIKIFPKAREVIASYPLDEQYLEISITLPPTYPLAPVGLSTHHRVGIDEKKWQSWLLISQGTINFPYSTSTTTTTAPVNSSSSTEPAAPSKTSPSSSTGGASSLLDGILAWRRNVEGALKGQSECAICYSVVGADRQLPSKRCGTCKNLFHGGCLYRWFRSSNSSSCPLCRNAFKYG